MSFAGSARKRLAPGLEGEAKRQRPGPAGPECTEEPHRCPGRPAGKSKWYAVWGGPNPGVHFSDWATVKPWAQGVGAVKQKSFGDQNAAWEYYSEQKRSFPGLGFRSQRSRPQQLREPSPYLEDDPDFDFLSAPPKPSTGFAMAPTQPDFLPPTPQPSTSFAMAPAQPDLLQPPPQPSASFAMAPTQPDGRIADAGPLHDPLCEEQAAIVDLVVNARKNVFYTGSAGVGKSTVLKALRRELEAKGLKVNVVAPTGRSALGINGQTTWSYAGWMPSSMGKPLEHLRSGAWTHQTRRRLKRTDVLIIDEISMVENHHFQRLSEIMKVVRQDEKPFGGVQVVVTGDFCQLPPVNPFGNCIECGTVLAKDGNEARYKATEGDSCTHVYCDEDKWAFRSEAWKHCDFVHVNLTQIHRQSDRDFIRILQKLRLGLLLLPDELHLLLHHESVTDNAVKIFPTREEVRLVNNREFARLPTPEYIYHCVDNFELGNQAHQNLNFYRDRADDGTLEKLKEHRYEAHLHIKKDMLVVLLSNLNVAAGLVNGAQGTVIGFERFYSPEDEQKLSDTRKVELIQDGLIGEYAYYRAERIHEFMEGAPTKVWPVVRFLNGTEVTIEPDCSWTELGDEPPKNPHYSLVSRTQLPLMAAWAMTIHKSQGMTLNRVVVDLGQNFEVGMAYVALSRVRGLGGLKVVSFPENAQMGCNEEVKEFLDEHFGIEKMLDPTNE